MLLDEPVITMTLIVLAVALSALFAVAPVLAVALALLVGFGGGFVTGRRA